MRNLKIHRSVNMIGLFLTVILILPYESVYGYKERILKSAKIVEKINRLEFNTWTADTYDTTEIDAKKFAQARLGVRMTKSPPSPKGSSIKELEKANIVKPPAGFVVQESVQLPVNFTWNNASLTNCPIGTIRDQSNCGSCWAVSAVSAMSDRMCIKSKGKFKTPLSEIHLTSCDKSNYGCEGGYMSYAYTFLKYNGTVTGGDFDSDVGCQPYSIHPCSMSGKTKLYCPRPTALTPKCRYMKCTNYDYSYKFEKKLYKISEYHYTGSSYDEYSIRKEIYENGTVTAQFLVYPDLLFYKKGIYEHKYGWWPLGGHAVRVIGWGEENGVKYWTVANSWGTDWGEDGFFRIKRGVNMCWFESYMIAVTPIIE